MKPSKSFLAALATASVLYLPLIGATAYATDFDHELQITDGAGGGGNYVQAEPIRVASTENQPLGLALHAAATTPGQLRDCVSSLDQEMQKTDGYNPSESPANRIC